jgi:hypothetical protein
MFNIVVPDPVTVPGVNVAPTPPLAGDIVEVNSTSELKPVSPVTVIVDCVVPPFE